MNPSRESVPPGLVIDTFPDPPVPTIALMLKGEVTVKEAAGTPLKLTFVVRLKLFPLIVIVLPVLPVAGANEVMIGCVSATYVNPANLWVPIESVIETSPDAPSPTMATILVGDSIMKDAAGASPKNTLFTVPMLNPLIIIELPLLPIAG